MEILKETILWFSLFIVLTIISSIEVFAPSKIELDFFCTPVSNKPLPVPRIPQIVKDYGNKISNVALQRKKKDLPYILPSVVIAQLILETAGGTSILMREANNLFGIKTDKKGLALWDDCGNKKCKFRIFATPEQSIEYYFENVISADRYCKAVKASQDNKEPKQVAQFLKEGGYATDPKYSDKIHNIIKLKNLQIYDKQFLK